MLGRIRGITAFTKHSLLCWPWPHHPIAQFQCYGRIVSDRLPCPVDWTRSPPPTHALISQIAQWNIFIWPYFCLKNEQILLTLKHGRIHHWESEETFPTKILTLEIYWGIFPVKIWFTGEFLSKNPIYWGSSAVKIRFRPEIDPPLVRCFIFCTKNWPLPKNSGSNPQTFQILVGGTLGPNSQETSGTCLVSPVTLKPRIRRCFKGLSVAVAL